MAELTRDETRYYHLSDIEEYPLSAGVVVYEGAAVGENGSGYARPLVAGDQFLGFASKRASNIAGIAGADRVPVKTNGLVKLLVSGITVAANKGADVYASNDGTFTVSAYGNSKVGKVHKVESDGYALVRIEVASKTSETQPLTWSTKPAAAEFGRGQAWFTDIGRMGYSDGSEWKLGSPLNDSPNGYVFNETTGLKASYTASIANNGTINDSVTTTANGNDVSTITLFTPLNNPAASATLTKDKTQKLSEDTSIPLLFSYYVDRLPANTNENFYLWISNQAAMGSTSRSRFITPAGFDTPGWVTTPLDKRTVATSAFGAAYMEPQGSGSVPFDFAQNMLSYRAVLSGSTTADDRIARFRSFGEGMRERAKVCITFDDSLPDAYHIGYKEAKKRNLTTTHFAIFDSLSTLEGDHTGMTKAQIAEIAADPMCYVGLHGNAAFDGTGTGAGLDPHTEMLRNITGLKALGLSDCKYLSWPNGAMGQYIGNSVAVDVAKSLGVLGARLTQFGYQYFAGGLYNPYAIRSFGLRDTMTLAQAKNAVDTAIEWGCAITFYGHSFGAAVDSTTWVTQDYKDLLDYIALKRSLGLIEDVKFDDLMRYGASI